MTSLVRNGIILGVVQIALVGSLGGKLLADRARYPRVWARTMPVDPTLPIRGRYVRLRLEVTPAADLTLEVPKPVTMRNGQTWTPSPPPTPVRLVVENGRLMAGTGPAEPSSGPRARAVQRDGQTAVQLEEPLAYFIPERAVDPSRREPGEELWVEVTVPPRGAPRPIRLGVKKDGVLTPI